VKNAKVTMNKTLVFKITTTGRDVVHDVLKACALLEPQTHCPECNDGKYDGKICAACQKYGPIKTADF